MLDSRKLLLALVVVALAAIPAFAQNPNPPLACFAQAAGTPQIRAEGVAEQVGDILITCSGGDPAAAGTNLRQFNLAITSQPAINITSRILSTSGGNQTEALLFIDEPTPGDQTLCGSTAFPYSVPVGSGQAVISGVCGAVSGAPGSNGIGTYDPDTAITLANTYRGNVFQARQQGATSQIWQGIPFDPPGSLTTRVMRITNVRVNASQLGVPAGAQSPVAMFISTTASGVANPIAVPITNPSPTVAVALNSLNFSAQGTKNCLQCENANRNFANDPGSSLGSSLTCDGQFTSLRYEELFPSVFRRRNQANPGTTGDISPTPISQDDLNFIFQTETGFYKSASNGSRWPTTAENGSLVSGTSGGTLGLADHGTRVIARLANIHNGIQVWVETSPQIVTIQSGGGNTRTGTARLVNTDPNGAGPFSAVAPTATQGGLGYAQVSIIGGTGQAVWEIINADTTTIERLQPRVIFAWVANTTNNLPSLGTSTANGNLAPLSTVATASSSAPLPRFVDGAVNRNLLTLNSCRSNILFPFITNQGGFDSGMAISNTTKDPFGTALQTGACTVYYYGNVAGSAVAVSYTSPSITGGEHIVWSLSGGGAITALGGFQGYAIARCDFQYAHGFAFISDLGAQKLAQGYLALILDDQLLDRGNRTGSRSETLGH